MSLGDPLNRVLEMAPVPAFRFPCYTTVETLHGATTLPANRKVWIEWLAFTTAAWYKTNIRSFSRGLYEST